ncbi:MAG: toll/interleukin-1 receptor domain-containing protein, partial [Caulobacterales bacterium]|nr:toll/interleukin-1 receptor domain-containing protein [Caulobacterales bacterium]
MKIFFSYGRDDNREIVEMIKNSLEAIENDNGKQEFEVWIDHREIEPNNDWRREIYDGVHEANWAMGFFSKHGLRKGGPCLDELQIAINDKKGALSTILLEKNLEKSVPASVASIQWLDMSDWREIKESTPEEFENWYQIKINQIIQTLRDPINHRFSGEIDFLRQLLSPTETTALIGSLTEKFIGREWLRNKLENWRLNEPNSKIFWITGDAGTGKSAFSAWLTHFGGINVISISLCRQDDAQTVETNKIIESLCFQLAARLPDYRSWLLRYVGCPRIKSEKGTIFQLDDNSLQNAREALSKLSNYQSNADKNGNGSLFRNMIIEGLNNHTDGERSKDPYLIIIDGLDEAIKENECEFAEIIAAKRNLLPK